MPTTRAWRRAGGGDSPPGESERVQRSPCPQVLPASVLADAMRIWESDFGMVLLGLAIGIATGGFPAYAQEASAAALFLEPRGDLVVPLP